MIRALFFQEFLKNFAKSLTLAVTAALIWVVTKSLTFSSFRNGEVAQETFDAILVACMLLAAATAGTSTFSRAFREGPLRLLEVLPLKRASIWFVRVFTSLATAAAGILVFLLVQPAILTRYNPEITFFMMGLAVLLFAAGCGISTLVNANTTIATGVTATLNLVILFVLTEIEGYISAGGSTEKGFIAGAAMGGFFSPVFLCLSFAVFIRGEMDTPRRRWRNVALGTGIVLGTVLLSAAAADAGAFATRSTWKNLYVFVSQDTAYVAAVQIKDKYSPAFRVVILDTATGDIRKTYDGNGLAGLGWTFDGAFIVFSRTSALNVLLHLGSESFDATRIFPTEERVLRKTNSRFVADTQDRHGNLVLLQVTSLFGRSPNSVLLRMNSSGQTKELLNIPTTRFRNGFTFAEAIDGSLTTIGEQRFLIREDITLLPYNLGHFPFASREEMDVVSTGLLKNPPPSGPVAQPGKYLGGHPTLTFDGSIWLYYLQADSAARSARLWARRNDATEWKEVLKDIPLSHIQIKDLSLGKKSIFTTESYPAIRADARNGVVAYLSTMSNQTRLLLFDLNSGDRFDLGDMNGIPGEGPLRASFSMRPGLRSMIFVSRLTPENALPGGFYYQPGSAPVRLNEPDNPWVNLIHAGKDGAHVYVQPDLETKFKIFYAKPPEPPRELRTSAP
jgi:hypothetical protein